MREKKRSRSEMRPVMLGTAVVLVLFLAGLLYLGVATWLQYKNSIIDKQKEQMLLTTQAISENLEQYIQEAQADLESLSLASEKLDDPDLAAGAREQLKTYADSHEGAVYDVVVLGNDGQITFRIRDSQVAQVFGSTTQEGQQVAQVQMEDKTLCLMLGGQLSQGGRLCLLIDLGNYYEKQIAQLHVGTNGYVLVKNSDGVILMHPEDSQLGTMSGGIAHEFNNLLTPILGHAELMLLDLPEDSELYDSAQEIAQAAGHCKEIIQQLSALSRKNVETVYKRLDAGEAFGRVMKMVRSICPDNVELDIDLDFGGAAFLGNETQLSQVVLNMAVNAVHAIGQKEGHIAITGRALGKEELEERGLTPPSRLWERYLCLDIRDDGCGMSSATLAQIFDPFFTTKKAGQGTGLGLSLADQIIRSHKGSITAESQVGQGSVFHILLPVAQAESVPSPALDGEQPTILLVGSSAKVLQMLSDSFRAMDVPVETARDWDEAAAVLERGAVDVLAADGGLEEERALDFCLSFQGKYPRLMKLLLVERPTREVLEAKTRGLIQGWLEKPVSAQAILEEAHRLLGEQAVGSTTL